MAQRTVELLGWPLGHSISPAFQNAGFAALGLEIEYRAHPVPPEELARAVADLRRPGCLGANVTLPHKEAVRTLVDELTPQASRAGAVNTVLHRDGRLLGHNTDLGGLARALTSAGIALEGRRVLLLGAGGAARAAAIVLLDGGAELFLYNRSVERAQALATMLGRGQVVDAVDARALAVGAPHLDLVVNATSAGLDGTSRPLEGLRVGARTWCYDLIYNPPLTPFLQDAQRDGARIAGGLAMLVYQGAESFELWTEQPAPVDVMMNAAQRALAERISHA